jgi:hypothetical protein
MQSAFHNLPTINGVMQAAGRQYEAREVGFHADDASAEFNADLAAAYPKEAGVEKWRRSVRLDRAANTILMTDRFALRGASGKIEMNLMTPCTVRPDGGAVILSGGMLRRDSVRITVSAPAPPDIRTEEIAISDGRLRGSWGTRLYRVVVGWPRVASTGELKFEITAT